MVWPSRLTPTALLTAQVRMVVSPQVVAGGRNRQDTKQELALLAPYPGVFVVGPRGDGRSNRDSLSKYARCRSAGRNIPGRNRAITSAVARFVPHKWSNAYAPVGRYRRPPAKNFAAQLRWPLTYSPALANLDRSGNGLTRGGNGGESRTYGNCEVFEVLAARARTGVGRERQA